MAMILVAASAGFTQEPQPGPTSVRVRNVKLESLKLHSESSRHAPRDESAREEIRREEAQAASARDIEGPHHAERDAYNADAYNADANNADRSIWRNPKSARPVSYATGRGGNVKQTAAEEVRLASPANHGGAPVRHVSRLREVLNRSGMAPYQQQPLDEDPTRDPLQESFAQAPTSPFDCPEESELTRPIRELTLEMYADENVQECPLFYESFSPRHWQCLTFYWKASAVCHKPLYFEEETLERYGHSTGPFLEPFVSGAHFFACVVTLPYHMGIDHPCECIYPLGYYRPGDCAPKLIYPLPLSARGALYQGAAVTGLVFLIP